jgi:formylglycine-generating enzyme required for sulfatase activity
MRTRSIKVAAAIFCLLPILATGFGCRRSNDVANAAPEVVRTKGGIEMVVIPAGWFEMGSAKGAPEEAPSHRVWVDSFLMDRYEVVQEQYTKLVGANPSSFKGPGRPVDTVTWTDAVLYCNLRSRAEGLEPCYDEKSETRQCNFKANGYRLPTEAEWEYACRAGTEREYYFGSDPRALKKHAWYADNSSKKTHVVGQKEPNQWGLYDMYGNVAEWCNDVYSENYYKTSPSKDPRGPDEGEIKVLRGGGWQDRIGSLRSSWRAGENCSFVDACVMDSMGFRCARNAPQSIFLQKDQD